MLIPLNASSKSWSTFGIVSKARVFHFFSLKGFNQQLTPELIEMLRRTLVGKRQNEGVWWHQCGSVRHQMQVLLPIDVGRLKISYKCFAHSISSNSYCVQIVESDLINFRDGIAGRQGTGIRAWRKIKSYGRLRMLISIYFDRSGRMFGSWCVVSDIWRRFYSYMSNFLK